MPSLHAVRHACTGKSEKSALERHSYADSVERWAGAGVMPRGLADSENARNGLDLQTVSQKALWNTSAANGMVITITEKLSGSFEFGKCREFWSLGLWLLRQNFVPTQ